VERTAQAPVHARGPIRGPKRLLALRSDARLVALARAGDDTAFEVLYERHVPGVLSFCRHLLRSQEEAEDAVQQAFVSAHGALLRGTREIAFKPWLYTIARNRSLSMLRARHEQPAELPELSTAGLNEQVQRRSDLRELVADLQKLPEQQRSALVLSELGDLSHEEIAAVIGYQPQAVKGLVFRARATLAERRDARAADCHDIRVELAAAKGGALRRGRLRYHLESCPGCVAYLEEVRRQRRLLGVALPVVPTLALRDSVMASAGIGAGAAGAVGSAGAGVGGAATAGGAAAAGGAATVGAPLLGGTLAKVAVVGALAVGGAGVASEVVVRDGGDRPPAESAPAERESSGAGAGVTGGDDGMPGADRAAQRRGGARGAERRARGQRRAIERSDGRAAAGEPRGKALGRSGERPGLRRGTSGDLPNPRVKGPAGRGKPTIQRRQGAVSPPPVVPRPVKPPRDGKGASPPSPERAPSGPGGALQTPPTKGKGVARTR
jgi:RNA polymerase sigma factor (sigma-70 family)